ncbi:LuxR C-terminal-related transcriptional regulator [Ktedonospora formicarum]|uniref:LuxR family transcriptional regulator n=1 Tax=Ktedonospora formicarum TaxID=2778364 RepID=A0A8J3IBD1_9CHLR|nr:LuxR C-terminal-related transcriptional regulator [Ktedonospora formicarum]GHO48949.1 LuxR family transcriptional regulator [Ktedonospora formicarum]
MPRSPLHALRWSTDQALYELSTSGHLEHCFRPGDGPLWLAWLETATSFAFQGRSGHLNIYKEARPRGGAYWYAYHTAAHRTAKRYLGQTANVTFARLEEVAHDLARATLPQMSHTARTSALHQTGHGMVPLLTRLVRPPVPATLVERERLLSKADTVLSRRLLLLSASAGSGKTTLLSAWVARSAARSRKFAWLTLDETDNDITRFWVSVIMALRMHLPGIGEVALNMVHQPVLPPFATVLTALINELTELTEDLVLILDDYHVIEEQAIHEALLFWLEHVPVQIHLVLASRVDPPFSLSRLRVRDQVRELRDADLRFQQSEAAHFLNGTMKLTLSQEEVDVLEQRTEGWIAGLQLAALVLQQREDHAAFVRAFTGSQRYLLDYIQEEILSHLEAPLQNFLLRISVLSHLNADLCQAVTEEPASQARLQELERAHLFLIALDEERRWYRLHDLFREALLARLRATHPTLIVELHRRAAHWYEEQGELREAIAHRLTATDFAVAASLMKRMARDTWWQGEIQIFHRWIMALPDAVVREHAPFALTAALYLLTSFASTSQEQRARTREQTKQMMARVEEALRFQENQPGLAASDPAPLVDEELLWQRLHVLRTWSAAEDAVFRNDRAYLGLLYQQMQQLGRDDEPIWQVIPLSIAFMFRAILLHEAASLIPLFLEARQHMSQQARDHFATIQVTHWLIHVYRHAGQLHQAYQEVLAARELSAQVNGPAFLVAYVSYHQGHILYQWNRLAEARATLLPMLQHSTLWQQIDLLTWGYQLLFEIELAAGDLSAAGQALQELERLQQRGFVVRESVLIAIRVQWWLANDNLGAADACAAQMMFYTDTWDVQRTDEFFALIHVYLAQNKYTQAVEMLDRFRKYLDQPEDLLTTISFLTLYALALHQADKHAQACQIAARLFALTKPGGYVRVYLNEGESMRKFLKALQKMPYQPEDGSAALPRDSIAQILSAFEQASNAPTNSIAVTISEKKLSQRPQDIALTNAPIEPLTSREREVLQLLSRGASNQKIAHQLVISLTTVKKHVSALLMKLNAENRTHAVIRARELSLL